MFIVRGLGVPLGEPCLARARRRSETERHIREDQREGCVRVHLPSDSGPPVSRCRLGVPPMPVSDDA